MNDELVIAISRHAQTDSNQKELWVGKKDDKLNSEGKRQAEVLADLLSDFKFDIAVSSDKSRTVETAEIISKRLAIPYMGKFSILRDRDYGEAEGLTSAEILSKFGVMMTNAISPSLEVIPGVEKAEDVFKRVKAFKNSMSRKFGGKRIVVIAHGSFVRAFYMVYVGDPPKMKFTNCAHFIVSFKDEKTELLRPITFLP